jgi:hypothetical protein
MSIRSVGVGRPDGSRRYPLALVRRAGGAAVSVRGDGRPRSDVAGWVTLETVVDQAGLHPDMVRRFVALSLLDASRDPGGTLWFPPNTPATIARIQRLRAGLCLNYAAIGVVLDLLDRIDALEAALGGMARPVRSAPEASQPASEARSARPWT